MTNVPDLIQWRVVNGERRLEPSGLVRHFRLDRLHGGNPHGITFVPAKPHEVWRYHLLIAPWRAMLAWWAA